MLAGIEAGGSHMVASLASLADPSTIVERYEVTTTTPDETLGLILQWLRERPAPVAIGIASFGPLDLEPSSETFGFITSTPKPGWKNTDILGTFQRAFDGVPCAINTDVNAAAMAELRFSGYPNASDSCAYITIGTGVGVGIVVGGKPIHGLLHPEMGHIHVPRQDGDTMKGTCPFHGACVEGLVSSGALARRCEVPAEQLSSVPDSHSCWDTTAFYLAHLCAVLALTVSPKVIVLGGGIMHRQVLLPAIRTKMLEILNGYLVSPFLTPERIDQYVVRTPHGTNAGVLGSLVLAEGAHLRATGHNSL